MVDPLRNRLASVLRRLPVPGKWRLVDPVARRGGARRVVARIPGVGLMELDLDSQLEREIFVTGKHGDEDGVGAEILDHLRDRGAVFVDVGANVGYHAIAAACHLAPRGGRVVAFEPIRANLDRLVRNVQLNRLENVAVHPFGLSDEAGEVVVHRDTRGSGNVSLASTGALSESVRLERFDDWAASSGLERIDILKMDIEGAEVRAIRGMAESLRRLRPILIIEINPMWTRRMGTSTTELIGLLRGLGYTLHACRSSRRSAGLGPIVSHVDPQGDREVNVVGIPPTV